MKKALLMSLFIIAAIILGGLIGGACAGINALSWLSYSKNFAFQPGTFDIDILSVTFGFSLNVNVAQLIFICIALFAYFKLAPKIISK